MLGPDAVVGSDVLVGPGVVVGQDVVVGPGVVVGQDVVEGPEAVVVQRLWCVLKRLLGSESVVGPEPSG